MFSILKRDLTNFETYRTDIPDGNYKLHSNNMNEIVVCPGCLKKLRVGDSYLSREYLAEKNRSYMVCKSCYDKESKEIYEGR